MLRLVREGMVGNDRIMYMQLRHTDLFSVLCMRSEQFAVTLHRSFLKAACNDGRRECYR